MNNSLTRKPYVKKIFFYNQLDNIDMRFRDENLREFDSRKFKCQNFLQHNPNFPRK